MSSKKNKDRDVRHVTDNGRVYLIIDGVIQTGQQEVEFYQREAIRSRLEKKLGQKILFPDELEEENPPTIKKEYTKNAMWAIADDVRHEKEEGKFDSYMDAYKHAVEKYVRKDGVEITTKKLQNAWHKAQSEGIVGRNR